MALNPFFQQGSASEQRLVQDLINEQLRMFGVDVYYMPREYLGTKTIIKENVLAKFEDNFVIEAYVQNYEGFQGSGDLMTKFGIRTTDELTLIISAERFEDFISPFGADLLSTRPKEGDLIYFPLSDSLFEIKFVEHENPFYQLGKLYMYELKCELFEYEDEVINTSIEEIDNNVEDLGYIATITFAGIGITATASSGLYNGAVNQIILINDGYGYTTPPTVAISTSPAGALESNATAVAITTSNAGSGSTTYSIKEVQIVNPGYGYTQPPIVTFSGAGGSGAIARAGIGTTGVVYTTPALIYGGSQYSTPPVVSISTSPVGLSSANATAVAVIGTGGTVSSIRFTNAGFGYTQLPTITIAAPAALGAGVGTGNFVLNEVITGQSSLSTARVKNWNSSTRTLKVSNLSGNFALGEIIVGSATTLSNPGIGTTGKYAVRLVVYEDQYDDYAENIPIENAADGGIVDFTETNPFGNF